MCNFSQIVVIVVDVDVFQRMNRMLPVAAQVVTIDDTPASRPHHIQLSGTSSRIRRKSIDYVRIDVGFGNF